MQEFAAAEENLADFCAAEGLPEPNIQMDSSSQEIELPLARKMRFDDRLLGKEEVVERADLIAAQNMIEIIKSYKDSVLIDDQMASLYLSGTPELEQYFRKHKLTNNAVLSNTLAIFDDLTQKGDYDLIFTSYGIVPVKSGSTRSVVKYSQAKWICTKKQEYLEIDGKFEIAGLDSRSLYELCMQLQNLEQNMPEQDSLFKLPDGFSLFKKND